jgi:hypothetical protein
MKFKKHGMKHEGKESGKKEGREHKMLGYSKMETFEKAMHGKNRGAGFKSYGKSKGGM